MLKKIAAACCALMLLSGCSSSSKCGSHNGSMGCNMSEFENMCDRVWFAFDSDHLSSEAQETLMSHARWLKSNPSAKVTIEGHCDERGTREYNIALGERRAESVKQYLVMHGVNPNNLTTISYGKERPEVMGDSESSWSKNRRAVLSMN